MRIAPGIGARLGVMMVLALLPLGLLSMSQTRNIADQARRVALDAALGETMRAAGHEIDMIRSGRATMRTLAAVIVPHVADRAACRRMMDAVALTVPEATLVAFVPLSGLMTCASGGREYDFTGNANFERLIVEPVPRLVINPNGPVSGTSVLGLSHPVFDAAGAFIGIVALSLPHDAIQMQVHGEGGAPVELVTFNSDGMVLTATSGIGGADAFLPRGQPLPGLVDGGSRAFVAASLAGPLRAYAVVPIDSDLHLIGSWPLRDGTPLIVSDVETYLFPVLMWIVGLAVALLASERLVTRHLRRLSRSMTAFTRGERNLPPLALDHPPTEIAELAEVYQTMTVTILRDEADLENLLRQKEELLREVHHRTGNSLQLIASIIRMHLREDPDDLVRVLLENLHDRVMSLSTVHFGLYRMAGRSDIAVDALLSDVIAKIAAIHTRFGRKDAIRSDLHPVMLTAQQAVPLALLVAEILSSFPAQEIDPSASPIAVEMEALAGNQAQAVITGPDPGNGILTGEGAGVPEIIATRLIRAFVQQLGGTMEVRRKAGQLEAAIIFTCRNAGAAA